MLSPDPATLRAVEAAARGNRSKHPRCDYERLALPCCPGCECWNGTIAALAAYHAALGETVRVTRVERCLQDGKEEDGHG